MDKNFVKEIEDFENIDELNAIKDEIKILKQ